MNWTLIAVLTGLSAVAGSAVAKKKKRGALIGAGAVLALAAIAGMVANAPGKWTPAAPG